MLGRGANIGIVAAAAGLLGYGALHTLQPRRNASAGAAASGSAPRCQDCHADVFRTYAHVGMARSFRTLTEAEPDLPAATVHHARSGRTYEVLRHGKRLVQRRYELDRAGAPANDFELEATHVIGSGNHARTYLHLTPANELIELPLSWYPAENRWAMSPGFDTTAPRDFTRLADESCLFCHNGYPRGGALAEGIDCERCHGPSVKHAALVGRGAKPEEVRAEIVNPARLTPALQLDVCMQCHLETTSMELPQAIRRFDREVFSFRPGEPLGAYMVHFDAATGRDRFEIVNQAYRLRQSACFRNSGGRLTCTTCHNPHAVSRGEAAVAWNRAKCMGCHPAVNAPSHPALVTADCARCHMPKRRTEDAVHVVMTDHLIARAPRGDLLAARTETARAFSGPLSVYYPELPPHERDAYLGAVLITGGSNRREGIALLERSLDERSPGKALAVLAEGRLAEGDASGAIRDFRRALERGPQTARLQYNLAQALDAAGQPAEASTAFEAALRIAPDFPEALYAYGNHLLQVRSPAAAIEQYEAAARARPVYAEAYNNLGNVLASQNNLPKAREQFEQALRTDPGFAEAHDNEARMLAATGQLPEALTHARRAVELKPDSASAHYNLGQLLHASGVLAETVAEYKRALQLRPDFVPAHIALGAEYGDSGRIDAAIAEFNTALRLDPWNAVARKYLDMAMSMRRR
jgi:predicted CXXCH cytochrome family protein